MKDFDKDLQLADDEKLQIVVPILKMSQICTKLKSLRIQSDIKKLGDSDVSATVVIDQPVYEKLERVTIPISEIILKGRGVELK